MIKTDKSRERVPKRFLEKRPDRSRPSTPEPELGTDPTHPAAPQLGPTPQLVSEEFTLPEGFVFTPGCYQAQRVWRDAEMQPDAFDVAIQECHADCLRANRGADGIPSDMAFLGYDWQLTRDGNGVLYNTIYATYAPAGGEGDVDAPLLKQSGDSWHPKSAAGGGADKDKQDEERKRKQDEEERQRQTTNPNQPQPGQPGYMPPPPATGAMPGAPR